MASPPYMKLFWGDYHRGTRHLRTAAEHGAYLLLIGALWDAGGRMKADDQTLADHALLTADEWAALKPKLLPLFKLSRGWISHKRVTEELDAFRDKSGKAKLAGKSGGEARARNRKGNGQASAKRSPTYTDTDSESPLAPQGGEGSLDWKGDPDIARAVLASAPGGVLRAPIWATTWLKHFTVEPGPPRRLVTTNGVAWDKITQNCRDQLDRLGVEAVLLQPAGGR